MNTNSINTLKQSYHDNYIQYKLTGNESYKQAFESAQAGMDSALNQLQQSVDESKKIIQSFYTEDVEERTRDISNSKDQSEKSIFSLNDKITAEKMKQPTEENYTNYYISIGVLGGVAVLLLLV